MVLHIANAAAGRLGAGLHLMAWMNSILSSMRLELMLVVRHTTTTNLPWIDRGNCHRPYRSFFMMVYYGDVYDKNS